MSDSWKKVGGFSRTGTQNYVRNNDATMGGTTFTSTDVSRNPLNPLNPYSSMTKIGDNAGIIYINGDIDMTGGADKNAPINRIKNVRDPSNNQDVATKHYVDKKLDVVISNSGSGFTGSTGPHGIGLKGEVGAQGRIGPTGSTGPKGDKGEVTTEKGAKGDQGPAGATGSTGAQGRTGPVGPAGPAGDAGSQGVQGNQGSNGQILWLNIDGIDVSNTLLNDQFLISTGAIYSGKKTVGPISVSATYGNTNFVYPAARFQNLASELTPLSVIPSGVWTIHIYADVPQTSDANQIEMYAALFLVNGTDKQPLPDGLIFETEEGGDVTYLPPREQFLPPHVKYIAKSWTWLIDGNPNLSSSGVPIISTVTKRYTIEMPIEFISLQQNAKNLYVQLQIYFRNTKTTNQAANARLYFQTDFDSTGNTTYSYIQSTLGVKGVQGIKGDIGPTGSSGPDGPKGNAGAQGIQGVAGPTGSIGMKGDNGYRGPTGPTGPRGYANSQGPQYSIQYRSDSRTDISGGDFSGNNYFKYLPSGTAAADPSGGTLVLKDLSCDSIHSPFYVTNELNTTESVAPRTFITSGDISNGSYSPFISTGINNSNNNKSIPSSHSNISSGIKFIHNITAGELQINMHAASPPTAKTGLKIDGGANIYAGQDKFVVSYDSGSVGVGGVSINELNTNTNLVRKLHVKGVTMIGDNPGSLVGTGAEANMLLNGPKSAPVATSYPGIYNRNITTLVERNTLNLTSDFSNGLGIISPQFITFQTGNSGTQNNSLVINSAGDVSVLGKTNLNGPLAINKNFVGVEAHGTFNYAITPNIDISGTMFIRSTNPNSASEKQKIRLISSTVTNGMTIPSVSDTRQINEITGVGVSSGGFLRLTAESATKSCIDLMGTTTVAEPQQNSVRIHTNSIERVFIDGTGKIGLHTSAPTAPLEVTGNTILRNNLRVGSTSAPTVALDVVGAAKISSSLDVVGSAKISSSLDMSSSRITSLKDCTDAQDAATKNYVDTHVSTQISSGVSVSGSVPSNKPTIINSSAQTSGYIPVANGVYGSRCDLYYGPYWTASTNSISCNISGSSTSCSGNAATATRSVVNSNFTVGNVTSRSLYNIDTIALTVYPLTNALQSRPWRPAVFNQRAAIIMTYNGVSTYPQNIGGTFDTYLGQSSDQAQRQAVFNYTVYNFIDAVKGFYGSDTILSCVAYFEGWIQAEFITASSDKRIKKNIKHIQDDDALLTLRKLKVSRFEYIDKIKKTPYNVYGFIAQDIKDILPETTKLLKDYIPNFYFFCMINEIASEDENNKLFTVSIPKEGKHKFVFTGNHDNSGNEYKASNGYPSSDNDGNQIFNVRFYDISYNPLDFTTTEIIDDTTFKMSISNERYKTIEFEEGIYFLYGQEVDDFHKIDKEHIYNVTTAALQEVDRQQQSDKQKITELEKRVAELDSKVEEQQSIITDILERLKKAGM